MSRSTDLLDALVLDLEFISIANGFNTDVNEVGTESKQIELVEPPAIYLIPEESGESDTSSYNNTEGLAIQRFGLDMYIRTNTPHRDILLLLDDVRNALERNGNTLGIAGVETVDVQNWGPIVTSEDIRQQFGRCIAEAAVQYHFTRGAL